MQGNQLTVELPQFTGRESAEEKITRIVNHLFILEEQLKYLLQNLDEGNFNQEVVEKWEKRLEKGEGNINLLLSRVTLLENRVYGPST